MSQPKNFVLVGVAALSFALFVKYWLDMRRVAFLLHIAGMLLAIPLTPVFADLLVRDDMGVEVRLSSPAQRIVSLAPHITELLFAAGAGQQVVGVVNFSDYPPEARDISSVGDARNLNFETILALQPDLVVAWSSGNGVLAAEKLRSLGVRVYENDPHTIDDVASSLRQLGKLTGHQKEANAKADVFLDGFRVLRDQYAGKRKVRVFHQIWHQPLMTLNSDHLVSQLITLCGGKNVFADMEKLVPQIDIESVLLAKPEVITTGQSENQKVNSLAMWKTWTQIPAVKNGHLYTINPDLLHRHTLRILQGAKLLCTAIDKAR